MVTALRAPYRPIAGGRAWTWRWRDPTPAHPWYWCRIYHVSDHTPDGAAHRSFGPLHRLDHHLPASSGAAQHSPDDRSILYVAGTLATAFGEVFGDVRAAAVCPNHRVALVKPMSPISVLDLRGEGAAMRIGALPTLATGDYPRSRTQEWARAIYEDQPVARREVRGIYYHAAHSNGRALALWNTADDLEVVAAADGRSQDFALNTAGMWPRVVDAAVSLGMRVDLVEQCSRCR